MFEPSFSGSGIGSSVAHPKRVFKNLHIFSETICVRARHSVLVPTPEASPSPQEFFLMPPVCTGKSNGSRCRDRPLTIRPPCRLR